MQDYFSRNVLRGATPRPQLSYAAFFCSIYYQLKPSAKLSGTPSKLYLGDNRFLHCRRGTTGLGQSVAHSLFLFQESPLSLSGITTPSTNPCAGNRQFASDKFTAFQAADDPPSGLGQMMVQSLFQSVRLPGLPIPLWGNRL
jgi:hypothetical protein